MVQFLHFSPYLPPSLRSDHSVSNFPYIFILKRPPVYILGSSVETTSVVVSNTIFKIMPRS